MVIDDYGGLRLQFERRKGLSAEEFERFLVNARKIAYFDKSRKVWVVSEKKLLRLNREELVNTLNSLRELSTLTEDQVHVILANYSSSVGDRNERLSVTSFLEVRGPAQLIEKILRDADFSGMVTSKNGRLYLTSLLGLKVFAERLREKYGVQLDYSVDLFSVKVYREEASLRLSFKYIDKDLAMLLLNEGVLTYNVEKPVIGSDGEYQGSELVQRTLKVARMNWGDKTLIAPVALLEKYLSRLAALGLKPEVQITEKPDIKTPLRKNFTLLPHQEEAFSLWAKRKRGTIAIFTRGGKSFIALEAIQYLRKPTLILVTTQELMATWLDYLEKYLSLPRHFIGVLGAGEQKIREITVATYSSAVKYIELIKDKFEFVVFDEAHHVPATTFKNVALQVDALYRLALSATPTRRDNNHNLLYELCGGLLYTLSYEDLVRLKVVAPIERFQAFFAESEEEKLHRLYEILREYPGSKAIVFTQYLKTAETVYSFLQEKGIKAVLVTGQTPSAKRELLFRDFLEGRANVIVSTTVLDEGITVPDAELAVIYEGSGEGRQMIQRIGRVLGYQPGKTAKVFEIINITNPKEKYAYLRRSWVRELYVFEGLKKYVEATKKGQTDEIKPSYQRRIDSF